jgi:hypothetical protein
MLSVLALFILSCCNYFSLLLQTVHECWYVYDFYLLHNLSVGQRDMFSPASYISVINAFLPCNVFINKVIMFCQCELCFARCVSYPCLPHYRVLNCITCL